MRSITPLLRAMMPLNFSEFYDVAKALALSWHQWSWQEWGVRVVSLAALLVQVYSLACPVEKTTKKLASVASFGWSISFWLSGALTAAVMALLSGTRQAVSARLVGAPATVLRKWAVLFASLTLFAGVTTYQGWESLLPIFAGLLSVYAYFFASNLQMRYLLLLSAQLWLLTYWTAGMPEGVLSVILSTGAALVGISRVRSAQKPTALAN